MQFEKKHVLFLLLILLFVRGYGQQMKASVKAKEGYFNVWLTKADWQMQLTRFAAYESIADTKISLDGKYIFVRHRPHKRKAYRLSIYRLKDYQRTAMIIPGYGGSFEWNADNKIVHIWGCGTNCANMRVYDLGLRETFFSLSSGGFELNPSKNRVIQMDMHAQNFWMFDLSSKMAYHDSIPTGYNGWSLRFRNDQVFEIRQLIEENLNPLVYDIAQLKLLPFDPKNTGEFYSRED